MRVTLILNPGAGEGEKDPEKFVKRLSRSGDEVRYVSAHDDFKPVLGEPCDLVVAGGGDGTVAKVVRAMIGRDTPILILPAGTANNIATSLGIDKIELDLKTVRERWTKQPIDVAMVENRIAVEAAGCGAIAQLIRKEDDEKRKGVHREAKNFAGYLDKIPAFDYRITVDGRDLHGAAILIAAMVISHVGPNLVLAPEALPGDGLLDLVIVGEKHREALQRYLASGGKRHLPELPAIRGESFTIACDAPWHVDDELCARRTRTVAVRKHAWWAMVPAARVKR